MESLTKRPLSNEELNLITHRVFGPEVRLVAASELGDGWFNTAYVLELDDRKVVLKISPADPIKVLEYERNIMAAEVEAMRLVRRLTQVPVPEIIYYDDSKELLDSSYFVMEWLEGQPYNKMRDQLSEPQRESVERELGRYNKEINGIIGEHFGYYAEGSVRFSSWSDCFCAMVEGVLRDADKMKVELPLPNQTIIELVKRHIYILDRAVVQPCLVHWDLWEGNFFVNSDGIITGVVDFERVLWGDPLMEIYFGPFHKEIRAAFCVGYGSHPLLEAGGSQRRTLYNLYLGLILYVESFYRGFGEEHKAWAMGMLEQELEKIISW